MINKVFLKGAILRCRFFVLGLIGIPKIGLGDHVLCFGKEHVVVNGTGYPIWDIEHVDSNSRVCVHEVCLEKIYNWKNIVHSVKSVYEFHMTSWYVIMLGNCTFWECFTTDYKKYMNRHFVSRESD